MGTIKYQRFVTPKNVKDPAAIWKALTNYYESTSDQNQNVVYRDFITFPYHDNMATFLDNLDSRLSNLASSKTPLTIASVKEALDGKRRQSAAPISSTSVSVKQETAFKANWATCKPGWHNPKTNHRAEDCVQAKVKPTKFGPAAKAAIDQSSDAASIKSISTSSGFLAICQASSMVAIRRALAATISGEGEPCFLDSGASHHMFANRAFFSHYCPRETLISLADGNFLASSGKGYVFIKDKSGNPVKLKALHVPKLAGTLISLGRLYKRNCDLICTGKNSFNLVSNGTPLLSGVINDGMFSARIVVTSQAQRPLEYVFMDLSGCINPPSFGGKEYYLKITDFFT
ncbi:uncharacterized protein VP01_3234g6 [Puccinia sorghi]|uniref:Retrovirus-related Pol polyprotein from transposon TNT 1-94-like beta-barrel domain-containing protein n=1 Tax=Puccinia sorghi TaxID=27349 RepID=A0A0L6V019_9BASI|nr:uncharacterized protein VP01_3234g6 [Puccinia sorghi]